MYARTNRCYNERGSRNNYVRSSIHHCTSGLPQRKTYPVNYIGLPCRSIANPHTSSAPRQPSLRLPGADVATNSPVQEAEGLRHDVANVG